jgi:hypothetical protein
MAEYNVFNSGKQTVTNLKQFQFIESSNKQYNNFIYIHGSCKSTFFVVGYFALIVRLHVQMDLVLFEDAVSHLFRVGRILR